MLRTLTLATIAFITCAGTACITIEENEHDCGDMDTLDATPVATGLRLVFEGPPSGSEIAVGATNIDVLCFKAWAFDEEVEIRKFRLYLRDGDGLVLNSTVQYRAIKVADTGGPGGIVAGPVELDPNGNQVEQQLVLTGTRTVEAHSYRTFCVRIDVGENAALAGHGFSMMLMPFEVGDVVLTSDGSPLPIGSIEPAAGLWTDLIVRN